MSFWKDFKCSLDMHDKASILASTPQTGQTATASTPDNKYQISTDRGTLSGWYCKNCSYISVHQDGDLGNITVKCNSTT